MSRILGQSSCLKKGFERWELITHSMVSIVLPAECWMKKWVQESTKSKDSERSCGDNRSEDGVTLFFTMDTKKGLTFRKKTPSSRQMKEGEAKLILTLA